MSETTRPPASPASQASQASQASPPFLTPADDLPPEPLGPLMGAALGERGAAASAAGAAPAAPEDGSSYLICLFGGALCALRLAALRGVIAEVPAHVALPFSPSWMAGIFPFRSQFLALVDPAPLVLGHRREAANPPSMVVVAGEGERSLGLLAQAVGEVVALADERILREPPADARADVLAETHAPSSAYVVGTCEVANAGGRLLVLAVERLVHDMLRAIALEEGYPHG